MGIYIPDLEDDVALEKATDYESVVLPTELSWRTVETPSIQRLAGRQAIFRNG